MFERSTPRWRWVRVFFKIGGWLRANAMLWSSVGNIASGIAFEMAFIVSRSSLLSSHLTTARLPVSFSRLFAKSTEKIMANPKVFFDIAINNEKSGRIIMEVSYLLATNGLSHLKIVHVVPANCYSSLFGLAWPNMAAYRPRAGPTLLLPCPLLTCYLLLTTLFFLLKCCSIVNVV